MLEFLLARLTVRGHGSVLDFKAILKIEQNKVYIFNTDGSSGNPAVQAFRCLETLFRAAGHDAQVNLFSPSET